MVITSVDRDDLPDQGSGHFTETVQKLKKLKPNMLIEALGMCPSFGLANDTVSFFVPLVCLSLSGEV